MENEQKSGLAETLETGRAAAHMVRISDTFSRMAALLFRIGALEKAVEEKASDRPPKITAGSDTTNTTGISSSAMTAMITFPTSLRFSQSAPATAP